MVSRLTRQSFYAAQTAWIELGEARPYGYTIVRAPPGHCYAPLEEGFEKALPISDFVEQ
ncbi:MAG: hypothetical protein AAGK78_01310 [Planctomycetota bacterium]